MSRTCSKQLLSPIRRRQVKKTATHSTSKAAFPAWMNGLYVSHSSKAEHCSMIAKSVMLTILGRLVIMSGPFLSATPRLALCAVSDKNCKYAYWSSTKQRMNQKEGLKRVQVEIRTGGLPAWIINVRVGVVGLDSVAAFGLYFIPNLANPLHGQRLVLDRTIARAMRFVMISWIFETQAGVLRSNQYLARQISRLAWRI